MGIELPALPKIRLHRLYQPGGIAPSPLLRVGFQRFQQKPVPVRLQAQGADVPPAFLPDGANRPRRFEKHLAQIAVKLLFRQLNLPHFRLLRPGFPAVFPVGVRINRHQAAKVQLRQVPRKIQHFSSLHGILAGIEIVIKSLFRQQLPMSSLLHDVAVIQYQNEIGIHDGA